MHVDWASQLETQLWFSYCSQYNYSRCRYWMPPVLIALYRTYDYLNLPGLHAWWTGNHSWWHPWSDHKEFPFNRPLTASSGLWANNGVQLPAFFNLWNWCVFLPHAMLPQLHCSCVCAHIYVFVHWKGLRSVSSRLLSGIADGSGLQFTFTFIVSVCQTTGRSKSCVVCCCSVRKFEQFGDMLDTINLAFAYIFLYRSFQWGEPMVVTVSFAKRMG